MKCKESPDNNHQDSVGTGEGIDTLINETEY